MYFQRDRPFNDGIERRFLFSRKKIFLEKSAILGLDLVDTRGASEF